MAQLRLCGCLLLLVALLSVHSDAAEPASSAAPKPAVPASPAKSSATAGPRSTQPPVSGAVSHGRTPAQLRIELVLDQRLRSPLSFIETPINQVTQVIGEDYDIPIIFDVDAVKAVGLTPETEVTAEIGNVSLKSALRLLLKSLGEGQLTYIVNDEVLLITSQESADRHLETRIYPVKKLVAALQANQPAPPTAKGDAAAPVDATKELAEALTQTVSPSTWQPRGAGAVQKLGDKYLIVLQTQAVHEEIETFLKNLSAALAKESDATAATTPSRL